ncbi:MAG: heat-inducible transcription repressor HrcA [Alphaproteobacteria bacterium]|nr:MAG: heat-inducible transcription repressor HrcA [Alphaproteobacteria bacterium]
MTHHLTPRERQILSYVIESYWDSGVPVGSQTLAQRNDISLSSATLRNVMSDLEQQGYLYAPHKSAGRLPTEEGLRFFVRHIMEIQDMTGDEKERITQQIRTVDRAGSLDEKLKQVSSTLSHLSQCAGIISAPQVNETVDNIKFVPLSDFRLLMVLMFQDGRIENRILETTTTIDMNILQQAENFINHQTQGQTLSAIFSGIQERFRQDQSSLDALTQDLIAKGLEIIHTKNRRKQLIVRGAANLINDRTIEKDLGHMRQLLISLENHENLSMLMEAAVQARGIQIFIGAENPLFAHSESAMVISPYTNSQGIILGTIGVIGPTALNYSKVIPMINYTARFLSQVFN